LGGQRAQLNILHMGTGLHHRVGRWGHEHGGSVLGITASWGELESYRDFVRDDPTLQQHYQVLYTNIYELPCALLPEFDVIALFHIGEFPQAETRTNEELIENLIAHLAPGGSMVFYTGSSGWGNVQGAVWLSMREEHYRSLKILYAQ